jgi:hypothetical protein
MHIQHDDEAQPVPHRAMGHERTKWADPSIWDWQDMRYALAVHDFAKVCRLLQRFGVSQRHIAARVEQAKRGLRDSRRSQGGRVRCAVPDR